MRIVIDLEAAQSPQSRNRGIGRYSTALAKAMIRHRGRHEILVALNGMYPESIGPVRESLAGLLPATDIVTWHAASPPQPAHTPRERRALETVRHSFFESLAPDVVHLASLFEFGPYSFPTIGEPPASFRTAVTLYDLIPHANRDIYFADGNSSRDYDAKLEHLRRADAWLAISESSRREGIDLLGLPADRVTNISSAADEHFYPRAVDPVWEANLRLHYGLSRPFAMYTGGIDFRKNIEGLIEAWGRLPDAMRRSHQLAIVCSIQPHHREHLEGVARNAGLEPDDLVLTGFVPEQNLVDLYRLCKLFVFPSLHEGFGLPALEAMSCGAAAIGANNSSIPEVLARDDALFDGRSRESIAAKLAQCLGDDNFRMDLARTGPERAKAFSWDLSAQRALAAIEQLEPVQRVRHAPALSSKPRLAYVAPMPPQRSGIAAYSAELLPVLAHYYDIDVVVDQPAIDPVALEGVTAVRDAGWFFHHGSEYDRVLYHVGNSPFHQYMLPLLRRHPGTVVLHDFFLSGLFAHRQLADGQPHLERALYESHGWRPMAQLVHSRDVQGVMHEFPANFEPVRDAQGVIVHSWYSLKLADRWYGSGTSERWRRVVHLRRPQARRREEARAELGLRDDEFLVCAFGLLGHTKLNHRLLHAWQLSSLATDSRCRLVFVGENEPEEYGRQIQRQLAFAGNAQITGWASEEVFRRYLDAADLAVQLRTLSRGETSGTVYDAMIHGVPLIVNANGAMADLPRDAAVVLDDEFDDHDLMRALEELRADPDRRRAMGDAGLLAIVRDHAPEDCARAYMEAIEQFAWDARGRGPGVISTVAREFGQPMPEPLASAVANAVAHNLPPPAAARRLLFDVTHFATIDPHADLPPVLHALIDTPFAGWRAEPVYRAPDGRWRHAHRFMLHRIGGPGDMLDDDLVDWRRDDVWCLLRETGTQAPPEVFDAGLETVLLPAGATNELLWARIAGGARRWSAKHCWVDVSELMVKDWQAGIARVVKNDTLELLKQAPEGYVVVPVYATVKEHGYRVATKFLCEVAGLPAPDKDHVDPRMETRAGDIFFGLDLQPYLVPEHARDFHDMRAQGVKVAFTVYDLLPLQLPDCFYEVGQENHRRWLEVVAQSDLAICISQAVANDLRKWFDEHGVESMPRIEYAHLGADIGKQIASHGMPEGAQELLERMREHPSFLMVGTLEPRKAYDRVIDAFEVLWAEGDAAMLVIVGRPGWLFEELVARLRSHPEQGKQLVWIEDASDEYLEELYRASAAMILASRGEGFGLPLVEAAQRELPVIARDLPVFREVAGEHAFYFSDDSAQGLAKSLREWMALKEKGIHPLSRGMPWLTWERSAARVRELLQKLLAAPTDQDATGRKNIPS